MNPHTSSSAQFKKNKFEKPIGARNKIFVLEKINEKMVTTGRIELPTKASVKKCWGHFLKIGVGEEVATVLKEHDSKRIDCD